MSQQKEITEADLDKARVETLEHIIRVQELLAKVVAELTERGLKHDKSKLESPEIEIFAQHTKETQTITYGKDKLSPEYEESIKKIDEALKHHYSVNRHHPQHHENGIDDMNIVDIVEMLCDWKASSERYKDGDIKNSIKVNETRFKVSPQLAKIFENSLHLFEKKK